MNSTPNRPTPPVVPLAQDTEPKRTNHPARMNSTNLLLLDPSPYPEIKGNHDPETVAMLKEDYAGAISELTAVTQYIFQNTTTKDETFANAMLQIAIIEMTHLDMLGDAIVTLGGNPRFDNTHHFWSAAYVDYSQTMEEMLKANIAAETGAIASYEKHAAATKNDSVRAFLLRIVDDERLHLKFFKDKLAELERPQNHR